MNLTVIVLMMSLPILIVQILVVLLMTESIACAVDVTVRVTMAMMMTAAAQQQHARHIYDQAEASDQDCLVEMDRDRPDQAGHGLIADQDRDHRQHDGTGVGGQIAELASAEAEARVVGMPARIAVGQRRQ